jgi:hypothetical protein
MSSWGGKTNVEMGGCTLRLPQPLIEGVRAIGARTGLTRSAIVAIALDDYLRRHGQPSDESTSKEGRPDLHLV